MLNEINDSIRKCENDIYRVNKFITQHIKDVPVEIIHKYESQLSRIENIKELNKILNNIEKSSELENGIFEFAFTHILINNFDYENVYNVYYDKLTEIINNLTNEKINNKMLKEFILDEKMDARYIAYLKPKYIHPESWKEIIDRKKFLEEKENNLATSDEYKCRKCGERKSRVTEVQIRSVDEPSTKFVTCLVCYNSFKF